MMKSVHLHLVRSSAFKILFLYLILCFPFTMSIINCYRLLCNKLPQNWAAQNNKHLLSHTVSWGQESGSHVARWFCLRLSERLQSSCQPGMQPSEGSVEDQLPSSLTWLEAGVFSSSPHGLLRRVTYTCLPQGEWCEKGERDSSEREQPKCLFKIQIWLGFLNNIW